MLTWYKVDLLGRRSLQYLIQRIELTRLRELTQIASVNDEIRCVEHRVDLVDRGLQGSGDVRIGWLVETDVTVADLHESEVRAFAGLSPIVFGECARDRNAAAHGPDQACTRPCHALQEPASVDSVVVEVLYLLIDKILLLVRHLPSVVSCVLS